MESDGFEATISEEEFTERYVALQKQLWSSSEFDFADVTSHVFSPPEGMYQVDHSFIHDGQDWHLFYVTGNIRLIEEWRTRFDAGDVDGAQAVCVEPGNGHAVGKTLFDLRFKENVFFESQGEFDAMSRACCSMFRHENRFGMLYDVRGDQGSLMSLAWSDDLSEWKLDDRNPVLLPPSWGADSCGFRDPHVMPWRGLYLIYFVLLDDLGMTSVGLITTKDWERFDDRGPVFRTHPALRGTMGVESVQVVHREGMWHLFCTHGPGLWHAVSPSPASFISVGPPRERRCPLGAYLMGPFHATEIVQDGDDWWLTTDRKEETRRLNRVAGRLRYRGSVEDELTLEEGLYLSRIVWDGDRPILMKPVKR